MIHEMHKPYLVSSIGLMMIVYLLRARRASRAYQPSTNTLGTWWASTTLLGQCYPSRQMAGLKGTSYTCNNSNKKNNNTSPSNVLSTMISLKRPKHEEVFTSSRKTCTQYIVCISIQYSTCSTTYLQLQKAHDVNLFHFFSFHMHRLRIWPGQ